MDKHLHIVTHDVPWPTDYGGVIDLFYKILALHSLGIKIHLHCFTGKRGEQPVLEKYCESVQYYPRKKGLAAISWSKPYIVQSRSDGDLLKELLKDDHPILLEGIHCTYFLQQNKLPGRKVFVRLHNIEYKYYGQLAKHETNILKKTYFRFESMLLKKFECKLANKALFLSVSTADTSLYKDEFRAAEVNFLPVFLPWTTATHSPGKGSFCLYHGNLSINENEKAAEWLLTEVFNELDIQLIIAGKKPSTKLQKLASGNPQTRMVIDPSETEMQGLIQKAQVNILPSFNDTGVKLKLLNALYNGRHCLLNKPAVEGSGLEGLCHIAETPEDLRSQIKKLFDTVFTEADMQERNKVLSGLYDNDKNARLLSSWIY